MDTKVLTTPVEKNNYRPTSHWQEGAGEEEEIVYVSGYRICNGNTKEE
jgi:hypothetical protein